MRSGLVNRRLLEFSLSRALSLCTLLAPLAARAVDPVAPAPQTTAPQTTAASAGLERVTFSEALQRALARNPSVRIAEQEILRAEALVRQAQASWLPTLAGNASYTRLDDDRTSTTGTPPKTNTLAPKDQLGANLQLVVPLFAPGRWLASRRAGQAADVQRLTAQDQRRQVGLATGRAFLSVVAARRQVEVAERARVSAADHERFSSTRLQGGLGNRLDQVRAAQDLAATEAALQTQQVAQSRAREALALLAGADHPLDAADDPGLPAPPQLSDALEQARARADVASQQRRLEVAEQLLADRWSLYAPLLTAAFQPFLQYPALLTTPAAGWQAQLLLTIPLYDGGLRYGQIREQRALAAEAREQLEAALRQAGSEVRAAFEALRYTDLALASSQRAAQLAGESLKLSTEAYQAGATTELDVLDAARRSRDADASAATSEDAARQARLELLAAAGRFP